MLGEDRGMLYTGFFTYLNGHISLFHSLTMGLGFVLARFIAVGLLVLRVRLLSVFV